MCCNHIVEKGSNVPHSRNIFPISTRIRDMLEKAFEFPESI